MDEQIKPRTRGEKVRFLRDRGLPWAAELSEERLDHYFGKLYHFETAIPDWPYHDERTGPRNPRYGWGKER